MAHPVLFMEQVQLTFHGASGTTEVLRGINLQADAGETVAVVGPSGSGKSSLLMLMAGLERCTGGSITVFDEPLAAMDEDRLARMRRERMGIVFQSFHLIPTMTALENVAVPLDLAGRTDALQVAAEELAVVGLQDRLHHYPGQLSGGEQQRVAIARAVAPAPGLVLADEPTGNLDVDTGSAIADLLFGLVAERRTTLILVTHDPAMAARADRTVRLADGRIVSAPA